MTEKVRPGAELQGRGGPLLDVSKVPAADSDCTGTLCFKTFDAAREDAMVDENLIAK